VLKKDHGIGERSVGHRAAPASGVFEEEPSAFTVPGEVHAVPSFGSQVVEHFIRLYRGLERDLALPVDTERLQSPHNRLVLAIQPQADLVARQGLQQKYAFRHDRDL